ncbi:DUF4142 domain-containing protein [Streptomyces albidochromogenes]|uniref:DUF4142 domain-containing protein n=1 Tax=Streptomyces albidochromogenes TaxID=329524 RepID=UPI00110FA7C0|nr:DUF4142 domain-containing protein [Streptomyces albidochromogenes]
MRPNRRAAQSRISLRAIAAIVALCAAVSTMLIVVRGDDGEAAASPAATGVPRHSSDHSAGPDARPGTDETGTQTATKGPQPATEVDRTFLVQVRQAGLWEIPAGRLAQTHASSEAVKRAGLHLIDGHSKLDQLVREDARILGVELPDQATPEQQGFVRQMENARGAEFDRIFANLLRASHGKIFATIGEVRAATQNDLIRRHARQANQTVLDHLEVLEDTGLVGSATLQEVEAAVTQK